MTTNKNAEVTESHVSDYMAEFCPFGWMDCKAAVEAATEAGYDYRWAAEQVTEYMDSCGVKIDDVDPVACVYDSILQEARGEIETETGYDLCNDCKSGEIYTAGNFMCTSYDYKEGAKQELIDKLAEHDVQIEDLSEATQWFLSQCEISQEDIETSKTENK